MPHRPLAALRHRDPVELSKELSGKILRIHHFCAIAREEERLYWYKPRKPEKIVRIVGNDKDYAALFCLSLGEADETFPQRRIEP